MIKNGDMIDLTFRNGYDSCGQPNWLTLDRLQVESVDDKVLKVIYPEFEANGDEDLWELAFHLTPNDNLAAVENAKIPAQNECIPKNSN